MTSLPAPFRTRRAMAVLNIAAVGLAMAAVTAAVFGKMWTARNGVSPFALPAGLSTAVIGALWAWVLRSKRTVFKLRLGWVLSVPLAALNGACSLGLWAAMDQKDALLSFLKGALLGSTFGAILWIPGLIITLLLFGFPLARAQRLARRGLAGEERGERTVGIASFVIGLVGIWLGTGDRTVGPAVLAGLGGMVTGASAAALALAREGRRKRFVADVEAGQVTGYRIDPTSEGKVLVRVTETKSYRVADFEEQIYELDAEGEATHAALQRDG